MELRKRKCLHCEKKYMPKRVFQKYCSRKCGSKHNALFELPLGFDAHCRVLGDARIRQVQWPLHMDLRPDEPI